MHDHDTSHDDAAHGIDPSSVDWEAMYADEGDGMWSGHVNGSLVAELDHIAGPGRALDVGCGEGADALWLAERGWRVTAIDVAPTAVARGRTEAERRGVDGIAWIAGDLLADPPAEPFDLVSLHYPAFPIGDRERVSATLRSLVAPAGTLLVVGHAPPENLSEAHFDPADWTQPDDLVDDLGDGWAVECHETRPRPGDHHHGSHHTHDVILRARRTG